MEFAFLVAFIQFISVLNANVVACAQNYKRDNQQGVSYARFVKTPSARLNSSVLGAVRVSKIQECHLHCINNHDCFSVNFDQSLSEGMHVCELINTDRFNRPREFLASETFDHYHIKTPCMSNPCKNGATCQPAYAQDDYHCACTPGYTGRQCEAFKWIQMTPPSVCFGARDDSPGIFQVPKEGKVITFWLTYLSGGVSCDPTLYSRWGCGSALHFPEPTKAMAVYITDNGKKRLLPRDLKWFLPLPLIPCSNGLFYSLPWVHINSPKLLFDNFSSPLPVEIGQKFQIWFVEDLRNCYDNDNSGQTCVRVHALFV